MKNMMKLLADLTPLNRVVCSQDFDDTICYMKNLLPFREHTYTAERAYNGWVIPPKWDVKTASIYFKGHQVYNGLHHPLAVMALSSSFNGTVDRDELRRHLHFDHRYDDAIPFHFRQMFRSWKRDWGFCVPRTFYDGLETGDYQVVIETEESAGTLRVIDYTLEGQSPETIVIGANLDHPGVANDGLSGVAVGVALFEALRKRKSRLNFSYRLVLAPGIIGNEYYLGHLSAGERSNLIEGVMLEMLGSPTELSLQFSRNRQSNIELALSESLSQGGFVHHTGEFESSLINDEYIWEAHGIPMASLSRYPYPEYHCDRDGVELMKVERLDEAVEVLLSAIEMLESGPIVRKCFSGNICLSNPRYDLYIDPGQVTFGEDADDYQRRMRLLMDTIPTLTKPTSVGLLADRVNLPTAMVEEYLRKWALHGLLELS